MHEAFVFNKRLGVHVLREDFDFAQLPEAERRKLFGQWALMCASMANRVADLEEAIMEKLDELYTVKTEEMHEVNNQMMEIASVVCDLNILSRSVYADMAKAHF